MSDANIQDDLKRAISMFDKMIATNDLIMNGINDRFEALEETMQRHYNAINVVHDNSNRFQAAVIEREEYVDKSLTMLANMADEQMNDIRKTILAVAQAAFPDGVEFVYETPKTNLRLVTKDDDDGDAS